MLDREAIVRLLPHADGMILLDRVVQWDMDEIICLARSHVSADHPLRSGDALPGVCAIEYGFQALALHGGLRNGADGPRAKMAVVAALRRTEWSNAPLQLAPSPLRVQARLESELGAGAVYAFSVTDAVGGARASGQAVVTWVEEGGGWGAEEAR
jgi:predicted hotdog family 3-hydroxylacyl-ACP dehydratase